MESYYQAHVEAEISRFVEGEGWTDRNLLLSIPDLEGNTQRKLLDNLIKDMEYHDVEVFEDTFDSETQADGCFYLQGERPDSERGEPAIVDIHVSVKQIVEQRPQFRGLDREIHGEGE